MSDFLLEIGTEEIPDWMIEDALADLDRLFRGIGLPADALAVTTAATPRRLVLKAKGLLARQADETKTVSGPPVSAGEGAARGFAKKNNVALEALAKVSTPKGAAIPISSPSRVRRISSGALPSPAGMTGR